MPVGADAFYRLAANCIVNLKKQNPILSEVLISNFDNIKELKKREEFIEQEIERATCEDERILKLREIPGLGLLGAYLMIAVVDDIKRFPNAKSFASYLGLVPREHSSGENRRLGSVTKSGNETLRRYLIHGARAFLISKRFQNDANYLWGKRLEAKKGTNKATVALAHKLSRICFALLRDGKRYKPQIIEKEFRKIT